MEFDFSWVLLGLPVTFALGWLASRIDIRQLRIENRQAPKAYFRGLNFLLNEQQDQAIDAFIEAVQNDPDTSELHFALGNLFRRRGEYERAVRVHQHLLQRGDLPQLDRDRAQHALALDYLKAGLLDRAEVALHALETTSYQEEARLALLSIYERSRDWRQATHIASKLDSAGHASFNGRRAHYLCELASALLATGNSDGALQLLADACQIAPSSSRPWIEVATLQQQRGHSQEALNALLKLNEAAPQAIPLAANLLVNIAQQEELREPALSLLQAHYAQTPSVDVMDAIAKLQPRAELARQWFATHLEREASLVAASRLIDAEINSPNHNHQLVQRALSKATKPLMRYRCAACGFEATQHFWHCPGCQAWDSYSARRIEEL